MSVCELKAVDRYRKSGLSKLHKERVKRISVSVNAYSGKCPWYLLTQFICICNYMFGL